MSLSRRAIMGRFGGALRQRALPSVAAGLPGKHFNEVPQLDVNICSLANRLSDICTNRFTEALAQPMHAYLHCTLAPVELHCDLRLRKLRRVADKPRFQRIEVRRSAFPREFVADGLQSPIHDGERPFAI